MKFDYAYGAFLGMLVGDAAGATLEFHRGVITKEYVESAMKMPGGGALHIGPGQITDDGELALSLAKALAGCKASHGLPLEEIASNYVKWYLSRPFDIGNTCRRAFSVMDQKLHKIHLQNAMMQKSIVHNLPMEANGSLMRIVPMAIWSTGQPMTVVAHNAKMDALLSHPNQICQDCNALYCIAISELIKNQGRADSALAEVDSYITNFQVHPTVVEWYHASNVITDINCTVNIGHVKYGFMLAFHFLRKGSAYEEAIRETLMMGGDTDTNAAIVGGMIGALHGASHIPEYMKDPVVAFDCTKEYKTGYVRDRDYSAAASRELVESLLQL